MGDHAVVIGGSIAGLLAARALTDAYERVTVVDRDTLPAGDEDRRAVPQGRHVHALLPRGFDQLEELLPGIGDELIEDGAPTIEGLSDFRLSIAGHKLPRIALGRLSVTASRRFVEGHVRRRILALGTVELRDRCKAVGLTTTADRKRVTGIRLTSIDGGGEEELDADLVVSASGRSAQLPAWLDRLGYGRAPESVLEIDLGYASRNYRLAPGAVTDNVTILAARPGKPRTMGLFAQEGDRWLLTVAGYGDHRPPTDEDGFDAFLATVAPADLLATLRAGEPLDEIVSFGSPSNLRRHYERMRRWPDGLLPIGDAICSFNPLYGQGMTVAALEAGALGRCLERGPQGLRRRYLRSTTRIVDHAWQMAIGGDLALPEVEGKRSLSTRAVNRYMERLHTVAERDADVTVAFMRVAGMLDRPSHLMRPATMRRVLGRRRDSLLWPGRPLRTPLRRRPLRVDDVKTLLREAGPGDASEAVVFVHGVPGAGADFEPLVAAAGQLGRAVAWDAPGFGRAGEPERFEQSADGHGRFIGRALDALGIERAHLVLHDFGGPWGLAWAMAHPERLASTTLICTGVLPDYRWHRTARIWRTPVVGEAMMATLTRAAFRANLRRAGPRPLPRPFVDRMFEDLDRGTRDAILRLYRSVDDLATVADEMTAALRPLDGPALVIWGEDDPYIPARLAERQREAFPDAEVHVLDESGHWPFVDQADSVEELLLDFLERRLMDPPPRPAATTKAARPLPPRAVGSRHGG
jgi:pimeloyl-ACP methyl ester carboxylesterase/2-polyprenyl-6-methoxyphenol hydroxylase-like FAD-dependent oxidoreductase